MQVGSNNLAYVLRTCLLGSWLLAMPPALDILHNKEYEEHINLYKTRQRPILRGGDAYHILPYPDGASFDGMQYHNRERRQGSVVLFKPSAAAPNSTQVPLFGLTRGARYRLSYQDRSQLNAVVSGAVLMDQGLCVSGMNGAQASEIIWVDELPGGLP